MKLEKSELAHWISKLKNVVPKKASNPALRGILVDDGYLIASNLEMTVKVKVEGAEGERFIIPERAFDLINNLPEGDMEISATKNAITIKADKIKNKYQSVEPDQFSIGRLQAHRRYCRRGSKCRYRIGHPSYSL